MLNGLLPNPELMMESSKNFWDCKIKSCCVTNNLNETSLAAISHRAICFSPFSKMKFSLMRTKWMERMEIPPPPLPIFFYWNCSKGTSCLIWAKVNKKCFFCCYCLKAMKWQISEATAKAFNPKYQLPSRDIPFFLSAPLRWQESEPSKFYPHPLYIYIYVAVNFLSQVIFYFFCFQVG